MYFNALPNPKIYLKDFFAIENGKVLWVQSESKDELVHMFGYGNVFDSKAEANVALEERKQPPKHHFNDDERKAMEDEQMKFGRMMMKTEMA